MYFKQNKPLNHVTGQNCKLAIKKKEELKVRLNRILGQINAIKLIINTDGDVDKVLHQIISTRKAILSAGILLMECRVKGGIAHRIIHGDEEVINELFEMLDKLIKKD